MLPYSGGGGSSPWTSFHHRVARSTRDRVDDAHRTVEGLARQFQPRDEVAFGFPGDSVARYGVLDDKACQIAADPPPKFSVIDNAGPLGGPIVVGAGRVAGGGAKPPGGPARYGPEYLGPLVVVKGAGMGAGVAQFGERGQRRAPVGGELGEHVGAEVFGAREDFQPVPGSAWPFSPVVGECAFAAVGPSDSCEESFLGLACSIP